MSTRKERERYNEMVEEGRAEIARMSDYELIECLRTSLKYCNTPLCTACARNLHLLAEVSKRMAGGRK
jgi:hypothetical protein